MTEEEQIRHFSNELDALVNRMRSEYSVSYAIVVGALQFKIHALCCEARERSDEVKGEDDT